MLCRCPFFLQTGLMNIALELKADAAELVEKFNALSEPRDVASLLEIRHSLLIYHIYGVPEQRRYEKFLIPKKSGGFREIYAPATALKIIQRKLNTVLQHVYEPKPSVHGFIRKRNIVTNATPHTGKKYVLNIDLEDFFPTINFGRVRGMFAAFPYNLNLNVATVLAQICCFKGALPQGAPTSPTISNMICAKMDSELQRLAKKTRCTYTRYADDITFSTSMPYFPASLAEIDSLGQIRVGKELERTISENGFRINQRKVRLQEKDQERQEVTGLTTNKFPNVKRTFIRQIRAMLHAWRKYGLEAAEAEFLARYNTKHRNPKAKPPSFVKVVHGKIEFLGMVRGHNDDIYLKYRNQFEALAPQYKRAPIASSEKDEQLPVPFVATEGKTDWKHFKAALANLQADGDFANLKIQFREDEEDRGSNELMQFCRQATKFPHEQPIICIFDRDEDKVLRAMTEEGSPYKPWNNRVFSLALPVPDHRRDDPEISVELCYYDDDIKRTDKNDRRLYLSTEFDRRTNRHMENPTLNCTLVGKIRGKLSIIDHDVFNEAGDNVALSKSDFATYILKNDDRFRDVDFSGFKALFEVILSILKDHLSP